MSEDESTKYAAGAQTEDFILEQIEGNKYVAWDKKTQLQCESIPHEFSDYTPIIECPWNLTREPIEYGNKENLWMELSAFLKEHIFLPDERLYDVIIAWVFCTWIRELWDVIPYLLVKGPMSSGKTRLLETLGNLAYRGMFSSNMTCAALFRATEMYSPTLLLDETEIYRKEEYSDVTHLLNAGYRRGQKAWRVEHIKDGQMILRGYDVFGFKALAGTEQLVGTLESRSIIVDMVKNIQRLNFKVDKKKALELRSKLLLWRFRTLSVPNGEHCEHSELSSGVHPKLEELEDGRLMELFDCLMKIANSGSENILSYALTMKETRESEEQTSFQYQVLDAMLKCKDQVENGRVLAQTIKEKINEGLDQRDQFSTRWVLRLLSDLGFKKTHLKKGNGIIWNEKMLEYRLRQYRMDTYTPAVSSLSSLSSPLDPFFTSCYCCGKPIYTEDWKTGELTANKPAHKECYESMERGLKA